MDRYPLFIPLCLLLSLVYPGAVAQDVVPPEVTIVEAAPESEVVAAPDTAPAPLTKVAIFPFRSRPKVDTRVGVTTARQLAAALEGDGRYTLLPQDTMANLGTEIEFTRRGNIRVQSAADWGLAHGMDYVIVGTVVTAGKGHGGVGIGGVRISAKAISLGIDIQLIQCNIAEAIIEDTFKEEKTGLGLALGAVEFDPESRRGSEMVASVMTKINRAVLTTIHPPAIMAIDESGQQITLNMGASVFQVGDRWEIFSPGVDRVNPKTGKPEASKPEKIGALEVHEVAADHTLGTLIDGIAQIGGTVRFDKAAAEDK